MKNILLIILFVLSILLPVPNIFAPPSPNEWSAAPYCPGGCPIDYLKQKWSEYYDYKGSDWMETKKQEMLNAMNNGTLNEWLNADPMGSHYNVHTYYFYKGAVPNLDGKFVDDVFAQEKIILSPLKQFKAKLSVEKIVCRQGLELIVKYDGTPACVKPESVEKLVLQGWGIDYESLVSMIENSDEIITAMIAGEEILPNGNRHVWLSTYEWLKSGVYDEDQLFLEQNKTNNPQALNVKFSRGEEVLLFVKEVDEKRGAYDIYPTGDIPPQKYPIGLRDAIVGITNPDYSGIKKESDFSSTERCSQKDLDGDSYWHCSSNTPFYVPIETTMSLVKEKILQHISERYFDEHFDLVSTSDVSVINGKETPVGQSVTFVYTIDDMKFLYSIDTHLEREFDEVYLRFVPPKQLDSIIHDDKKIEKLAYSCLDSGTYKIYWQPYRIGAHIDEGFSPFIAGAGPPTVYDRWNDNPIQRNEKTFRIWLVNGDVECKEFSAEEFEVDKFARPENILLIDSTEFHKIKGSN